MEGAVEGERYGRASWLLAWDGSSPSAWGFWGAGEDPWGPDWGPDIGLPVEDAMQVGPAWIRRYGAGIAVVNPSERDGVSVSLGGVYRDPDFGEVDTLTLDAGYGRVLSTP